MTLEPPFGRAGITCHESVNVDGRHPNRAFFTQGFPFSAAGNPPFLAALGLSH